VTDTNNRTDGTTTGASEIAEPAIRGGTLQKSLSLSQTPEARMASQSFANGNVTRAETVVFLGGTKKPDEGRREPTPIHKTVCFMYNFVVIL